MKKELQAAAKVSRQVSTLYRKTYDLVSAWQTTDDQKESARIESEIASLRKEAESCCEQINACSSVVGIIDVEMRQQASPNKIPANDDFIVRWAAQQCRSLSDEIRQRTALEATDPELSLPRGAIEQFYQNELFHQTAVKCDRAAEIAEGLAFQINDDDEADGPCSPFTWRNEGKVVNGSMGELAWKMVDYLWSQSGMICEWRDLAEPMYGDPNKDIGDNAIQSQARNANSFFKAKEIPWKASYRSANTVGTATVRLTYEDRKK